MPAPDITERLKKLRDDLAPHISDKDVEGLENLTIKDVRDFATQAGESATPGPKPASIVTVVILVFAAR